MPLALFANGFASSMCSRTSVIAAGSKPPDAVYGSTKAMFKTKQPPRYMRRELIKAESAAGCCRRLG